MNLQDGTHTIIQYTNIILAMIDKGLLSMGESQFFPV